MRAVLVLLAAVAAVSYGGGAGQPRKPPLWRLPTTQAPSTTTYSPVDGPNINVSTLLNAVGTPHCMRRCVGRLAFATKKLLSFENTTERFKEVCEAYNTTKACLEKKIACEPKAVFNGVTSGLEYACIEKKDSFARIESCMKDKLDGMLKECDATCHLRTNLSSLSTNQRVQLAAAMGGNLLVVADQLPDFCSSIRCMLPCVVEKANAACPLSGWLIIDGMLQPFDEAAELFSTAPDVVQQLIREKLTDKCFFLFDVKSLAQLRKGELH